MATGLSNSTAGFSISITKVNKALHTTMGPLASIVLGKSGYTCLHSSKNMGTLIHMLWHCPKLYINWSTIFQILNNICSIQIPPDSKLAILGIIPEDILPDDFSLLWTKALHLACKLILQSDP